MKTTAIALTVILFSSFAFAAENNHFDNQIIGIELDKPKDWHFESSAEFASDLQSRDINDPAMHQYMIRHVGKPLVSMIKHPRPYNGLNPMVAVFAKDGITFSDPVQILNEMLVKTRQTSHGFQLLEKPHSVDISGHQAAETRFSDYETTRQGNIYISRRFILIPKNNYYYSISASTVLNDNAAQNDINNIINSINIYK